MLMLSCTNYVLKCDSYNHISNAVNDLTYFNSFSFFIKDSIFNQLRDRDGLSQNKVLPCILKPTYTYEYILLNSDNS